MLDGMGIARVNPAAATLMIRARSRHTVNANHGIIGTAAEASSTQTANAVPHLTASAFLMAGRLVRARRIGLAIETGVFYAAMLDDSRAARSAE